MRINFKNKVYKTNDFLVEMYVGLLVTGKKTIEQVPNYGNLRAVVQGEVDRINREYEEKHKKAVEEVATPKEVVTEAPKEVVATAPVSETPKETTVEEHTERKEEHAE